MIGIAKTADEEARNEYGLPVTANVPANRGNFHQAVDNSVNKALPWVAFAWGLAFLAIGMIVVILTVAPAYIDAKIAAGVAPAMATAQAAKEHARVALDKVEQTQVQLGAKGIIQPSTH